MRQFLILPIKDGELSPIRKDHRYYYKKNHQGDVLGIADGGGNDLCEFRYDAYGMPYVVFRQNDNGSTTIQAADLGDVIGGVAGQIVNAGLGAVVSLMFMMLFMPQGYRGYTWVFMGSTVGYYCGSRFYMPELGRFLNADAYTDTGSGVVGTNMFAYCNNNPVMFVDPDGEASDSKITTVINNIVNISLFLGFCQGLGIDGSKYFKKKTVYFSKAKLTTFTISKVVSTIASSATGVVYNIPFALLFKSLGKKIGNEIVNKLINLLFDTASGSITSTIGNIPPGKYMFGYFHFGLRSTTNTSSTSQLIAYGIDYLGNGYSWLEGIWFA